VNWRCRGGPRDRKQLFCFEMSAGPGAMPGLRAVRLGTMVSHGLHARRSPDWVWVASDGLHSLCQKMADSVSRGEVWRLFCWVKGLDGARFVVSRVGWGIVRLDCNPAGAVWRVARWQSDCQQRGSGPAGAVTLNLGLDPQGGNLRNETGLCPSLALIVPSLAMRFAAPQTPIEPDCLFWPRHSQRGACS